MDRENQEIKKQIAASRLSAERLKRKKQLRKFKILITSVISLIILGSIVLIVLLAKDYKETKQKAEAPKPAPSTEVVTTEATTEIATLANATPSDTSKVTTFDFTFIGDCELADDVSGGSYGSITSYEESQPTTYFFEKVYDYFKDDDLTIANCENAFSDQDLAPRTKEKSMTYTDYYAIKKQFASMTDAEAETAMQNTTVEVNGETIPFSEATWGFWFKTKSENARIFSDNSIEAVSIANNHASDFGEAGIEDTKKALDAAKVQWGLNDHFIKYEKDGITFAIICTEFYGPYNVSQTEQLLEEAKKESDFQILFVHSGTEGTYEVDQYKVDEFHKLVDMGADLIISSHPHVLQPVENYNGVDIVYSLGNFCFGGNNHPNNRTAIYKYQFKITQDKQIAEKSEEIIPCYVYTGDTNNWQPAPIEDEAVKDRVLKFMGGWVDDPN